MAKMIINGEPSDAASGATTEVRNPATGELVDKVPKADAEDTPGAPPYALHSWASKKSSKK